MLQSLEHNVTSMVLLFFQQFFPLSDVLCLHLNLCCTLFCCKFLCFCLMFRFALVLSLHFLLFFVACLTCSKCFCKLLLFLLLDWEFLVLILHFTFFNRLLDHFLFSHLGFLPRQLLLLWKFHCFSDHCLFFCQFCLLSSKTHFFKLLRFPHSAFNLVFARYLGTWVLLAHWFSHGSLDFLFLVSCSSAYLMRFLIHHRVSNCLVNEILLCHIATWANGIVPRCCMIAELPLPLLLGFAVKLLIGLKHELVENVEVFHCQYVENIFVVHFVLERVE